MTSRIVNIVLALALLGACALAQDQGQPRTVASVDMPVDKASSTTSPRQGFESGDRSPVATDQSSPYYWETIPVGDSAQLLTLFCRACGVSTGTELDVPLVSVLRDTFGDQSGENDRVTYMWLLTCAHPRMGQCILSAIPFFYWRISKGSKSVSKHDTVPFMDLSAPENPMMARVGQDLLQWTAFDPMTTPVRASTHAYGTNRQEDERLHIEEAISYLRQAPVSNDSSALTQVQLDTVIGKLKLRETLLGGLGSDNQAARVGMQSDFEQERIRSRNRELLRQWAEKTGLIFEPLNLLPDVGVLHRYWLYRDEDHQLVILTDPEGNIGVRPVAHLHQDQEGKLSWSEQSWAPGFPLHLFEDSELQLPARSDRGTWLSAWHTEHEWMHTVHRCEYSNAVIGITEELSPVAANVPGPHCVNPILLRFERRCRELVQADFHVFASDHWNFNSRFPNPGGNHGSFFRISTHSVWMLAGAGVAVGVVTEPYDSLNFGSTVLSRTGQKPPMPDRVVTLIEKDSDSVAHAEERRFVQPRKES